MNPLQADASVRRHEVRPNGHKKKRKNLRGEEATQPRSFCPRHAAQVLLSATARFLESQCPDCDAASTPVVIFLVSCHRVASEFGKAGSVVEWRYCSSLDSCAARFRRQSPPRSRRQRWSSNEMQVPLCSGSFLGSEGVVGVMNSTQPGLSHWRRQIRNSREKSATVLEYPGRRVSVRCVRLPQAHAPSTIHQHHVTHIANHGDTRQYIRHFPRACVKLLFVSEHNVDYQIQHLPLPHLGC